MTRFYIVPENDLSKGGPYVGPKGGLWADPQHTQHWEPPTTKPAATTEPEWRIHRIEDLREIDWDTGKPLPLAAGEGATCSRCGKEHAVVYHMEHKKTGAIVGVGSGCGPGMAGGTHNIDDASVKQAEKEAKIKRQGEARARLDGWVAQMKEYLAAEIQFPKASYFIGHDYHVDYDAEGGRQEIQHPRLKWGFPGTEYEIPIAPNWNGVTENEARYVMRKWLASKISEHASQLKIPELWPFPKDLKTPRETVEAQALKMAEDLLWDRFRREAGYDRMNIAPKEMLEHRKPWERDFSKFRKSLGGERFYILPNNLIDHDPLIMYSLNQEESDMAKGGWHGTERPGHKYTKRERGPDGKYRYWYPEEHERDEEHKGYKYEEGDYKAPLYRVSDDVALPRLLEMGNRLHTLQAMGEGKDDIGFSNYDMHTWDSISLGAKADNPATMASIRRLLAKYKRQLTEGKEHGLDAYYYLGLADAAKAKKAGTVGLAGRWRGDGGFLFSLMGYLGDGFKKWMAIKNAVGIKTFKDNRGDWVELLPADKAETFDFDAFRERVAEIGLDLQDIPARPVIEKKPLPTTVDGVWAGLKDKSLRNAVGVKYDPEKKAFAFRFTPGKISTMMSNSKGDLGSITKWDVSTEPWTVWVFDIYAADQALTRVKELEPNFMVVLEGVNEARQAEEARQAMLRIPIPEVQAMAAPDINLFPYQNEGVRFLLDNDGNAMLGDEMGLGKLGPVDEPVLTPEGWRPLGDIAVGDEVIGVDGKPVAVVGVFPQGEQDIVRVTMNDGSWTRCGWEHLWSVQTRNGRTRDCEDWRTLTTRELVDAGLQDGAGNNNWWIPMVSPVQHPEMPLPIEPYLLGVLLGDGGLSSGIRITTDEEIVKALKIDGASRPHATCSYVIEFNCRDKGLRKALASLGLAGKRSWEKYVPHEYMHASPEQRLALLQGLLDTDGSPIAGGGLEFNSTSEALVDAVVELCESLGGSARKKNPRQTYYTLNGEKYPGRLSWRVNVKLPPQFDPFRLSRKLKAWIRPTKYLPNRLIKSIEPDGREEAVCIRVANADGLYVTRRHIVTHNTVQALAYGAVAKRRMIIVNPKNTRRNWIRESQKFFPGYYKPVELDSANLLKIKRQLEKEKEKGKDAKGELNMLEALYVRDNDDLEIAKRLGLTDGNLASINYESVGKFMPYLKAAGFDTMVVDESHRAKDSSTQVSKTLTKLAGHTQHHILLSGTAIMNKRSEFFSQFNIVKPGMFKSKEELTANKIGELWDKMRPFYLARQKRYVLKDLPPKLTTILTNEMPEVPTIPRDTKGYLRNVWAFAYANVLEEGEKQGHAAEDYEDHAREEADMAVAEAQEELEGMDPYQKREMFRTSIGEFTKLGFAAAIAKVPHTADFVQDILQDSDQNAVIFTESKVAAKRLAKKLGDVAVLHHGDMSQNAREDATARFDKGRRSPDEKARVLITTRPAAAQGINLTTANVVVFNDLPWTGAAVAQAEDRAHRVGQDRGVNVYWMTATDNELDQNKSAIVHRKYILHRKSNEGRPLTPAEKKWMDEKVSLADLLKPRDEVGPDTGTKTSTKEIKDGKTVTTEVDAPEGPREVAVHTEAEGEATPKTEDAPIRNAELEHNERPKFIIPATKAIERAKPAGGAPDTGSHEHAGANVHPPEDKLESKVEAMGQPQQLSLFKALRDDSFVLSGSDFDLCMSYADRLVDIGEFEDAIDLIKAAGHKYIRRIPTGKPKPRWSYIYNVASKHHDTEAKEGEKVRISHEGQAGHYEVEKVHANGYVTVKHDETGQQLSLKKEHLHEMFSAEHQSAIQTAHERLKRTAEAAKVHGSDEQQARARKAVRDFENRYLLPTPERLATKQAQALTMQAKHEPSTENHQAAADAHAHAAQLDTEHKGLHADLAKLHKEAAELWAAKQKQTPAKPEASPDEEAVTVVKPKEEPKAKGAFFADKRRAFKLLVADEISGDHDAANKRYWDWKDGRGPKPAPYTGGELDAVNQALGLEPKRKGFTIVDPRVSSLAEGWDRLVAQSRRWDSNKVMAAIEVLRQVPGLEQLTLPPEAEEAHAQRAVAEQEEQAKQEEAVDRELDDKIEDFSDADMSFDPEELGGYMTPEEVSAQQSTFAQSLRYQPNMFVTLVDRLWTDDLLSKGGGPYVGPRGGMWADPRHTIHWDPSHHTAPVPSDEIEAKVAELAQLPHEELAKIKKQQDEYLAKLNESGAAVPIAAMRLGRIIDRALDKRGPRMVAKVPEALAGITEKQRAAAEEVARTKVPFTSDPVSAPSKMEAKIPAKPTKPTQTGFDFSKKAAESITPNPAAQAKDDLEMSVPVTTPAPTPVAVVEPPAPKPETKPKAKAAPTPKAKAKPETKAKPEGKLVQTGEHIWGSRFDLAQIGKITAAEQLNSMSYQDAAYLVTKANMVPTHDMEVLRAQGQSPGAAHMTLALLATIRAKPDDTDKSRRAYVEACHEVVESVLNCKTRTDFDELLSTFRHKNRDTHTVVTTLPDNLRGYNEANEWAQKELKRLQEANPDKTYGTTGYGGKIVEVNRAIYSALGPAFERFIAHKGQGPRTAFIEAYRAENLEAETPSAGWEYLKARGQTNAEEKAKAKAEAAEKAKRRKGKVGAEEDPSNAWRQRDVPEEVEREGGKKIKDPDPARIKKTFGLREVDYGQAGYMTEKDRAYHTARLEEALTDFADILGVDPKLVSFNGRLGIALGARGRGHAAAHYETGRHVINITKFNGGGSVAHEWGHALDNIMGTIHLGNKEGKGSGIYLSEKREHSQLPEDVKEAIQDVWKAITKHPNPEEARRIHNEKVTAARAEMNDLIGQNNEMVGIVNKLQAKPTAEDLPKKLGRMANQVKGYQDDLKKLKEKAKTTRLVAHERKHAENLEYWIGRVQRDQELLKRPDAVRTPEEEARMTKLKGKIEDLRYDINRARSHYKKLQSIDPEASKFYSEARVMGEYWFRTVELFARGFEAHIEDRLKAKGRKSTYLVSGTQSGGLGAGAYPAGAERENVNRAMGKLMDVLHKGGHLEKALRALSLPLQRFTIQADMHG